MSCLVTDVLEIAECFTEAQPFEASGHRTEREPGLSCQHLLLPRHLHQPGHCQPTHHQRPQPHVHQPLQGELQCPYGRKCPSQGDVGVAA